MNKFCVTILNAGPGMGFYVPGVIMERQLLAAGISVELHVFESFYKGEKKSIIPKMKQKFHKSFSFALMGQNMANDPSTALDENLVSALLNQWIEEGRQYFIVFSGFWLSILNRFLKMTNRSDIKVDLCHLDADYSVSWKMYNCNLPSANTQWFHSWGEKKINYYMDVDGLSPLPFSQRRNNLVIHGGGWGLGDFAAKADDLKDTDFIRSLIVYEDTAIDTSLYNTEFYLLDPKWNIWCVNDDHKHTFPPLSYIDKQHNNQITPLDHNTASPLYNIVKNSKAIISKPGAGTLIDSLSAATPLIILEPYGNSENKNGLLWKEHGLGISFEDWKKTNFSPALLEQMHLNLLNIRSTAKNYITSYIKNHGL